MAKRLSIPDEYRALHQKLLGSLPHALRNDQNIHNIILVYLKFGGEKLARQGLEIIKMRHKEEMEKKDQEALDSNASNAGVDVPENPDSDYDTLYSKPEN